MIVRISGTGQFELDDDAVRKLDQLDTEITDAIHNNQEEKFHDALHRTVSFVRENGTPVPHDQVVPSEVIIPPEDVTLAEAKGFFTDEGLMQPLPA